MRKELMDDGFYLGDLSILDQVAWVRADRLAVRRDPWRPMIHLRLTLISVCSIRSEPSACCSHPA